MNIKRNEIMFLIAFLGVFAAVAVYLWVYVPVNEKTEALEAENRQHATHVAELEEWEKQLDYFREETTRMIVEVNDVFAHFPSDAETADVIMYAVELEEQNAYTYISNIGISQPQLVYEAKPTTVKLNSTMEEGERTYRLYQQQISYTQEFSYKGMKQYVNSIVGDADRKSIESINMAYDSTTGILVGSTSMNLYTLKGTDQEYQETYIPSMSIGTENIFGTRSLSGEEAAQQ